LDRPARKRLGTAPREALLTILLGHDEPVLFTRGCVICLFGICNSRAGRRCLLSLPDMWHENRLPRWNNRIDTWHCTASTQPPRAGLCRSNIRRASNRHRLGSIQRGLSPSPMSSGLASAKSVRQGHKSDL